LTLPTHWPPAPAGKPEAPERRAFIARLMGAGLWVRGESAPQLAAHWGYATKTIEGDSAEASAFLRAAMPAAGDARAQVVAIAQSALEDAAQEKDHSKRAKVKLDAAKVIAQVTGANAPVRQQVQVTDGDEPWFEPEAK
jgi:hypothetical protein